MSCKRGFPRTAPAGVSNPRRAVGLPDGLTVTSGASSPERDPGRVVSENPTGRSRPRGNPQKRYPLRNAKSIVVPSGNLQTTGAERHGVGGRTLREAYPWLPPEQREVGTCSPGQPPNDTKLRDTQLFDVPSGSPEEHEAGDALAARHTTRDLTCRKTALCRRRP